jgi:DNA (cytosine-5)-methyltransferase 1
MKYKVLSLFSGLAGLDLGFSERVIVHRDSVDEEFVESEAPTKDFVHLKQLPFTTVFQNDILKSAKEIAEWNGWAHNYVLKDIKELLDGNYEFPEADVVTGGFPCQDFSHSGKRKGLETSRGTLYQSFVEVVKRVKPTIFIAENVNGLLTMKGKPIEQIISDFSDVGYQVKYQLIKCEEFGIPQTRWRVIIMGVKSEKSASLPDDWNIITKNHRTCKIGPYFKHLEEPDVTEDSAQKVYSKAKRLPKGQGQKEVGLGEFGPTMRAEHHGNIEFRRITGGKNGEDELPQRRLTVREASLIQTLPPDCILTEPNKKPTMKAYKPIGNAVPPLLGYLIAEKVSDIFNHLKSASAV